MKHVCLVGAGPSLRETWPKILELKEQGAHVACVNHSHDWLVSKDIIPRFCLMPESTHRIRINRLQDECEYVTRQDASPRNQQALVGAKSVKTYPRSINTLITERGLPAVNVLYWLGYRKFDLFGYDGSIPENQPSHMDGNHPWASTKNSDQTTRYCIVGDKIFRSHKRWRHQTNAFIELLTKYKGKVEVEVHGDGMLAHLSRYIKENTKFEPEPRDGCHVRGAEVWIQVKGDQYTVHHRPATLVEAKQYAKGKAA